MLGLGKVTKCSAYSITTDLVTLLLSSVGVQKYPISHAKVK